jgi:hypothetical protein
MPTDRHGQTRKAEQAQTPAIAEPRKSARAEPIPQPASTTTTNNNNNNDNKNNNNNDDDDDDNNNNDNRNNDDGHHNIETSRKVRRKHWRGDRSTHPPMAILASPPPITAALRW